MLQGYGLYPDYISKVLMPVSALPGRATLRSSTCGAFDVPHTRTEFGMRAFSVAEAARWNNLPPSHRQITNIWQFKRSVKAHLYGVAYNI